MVSDILDKQALLNLRLANRRLNDIVQRSLHGRKIVIYLQSLRPSIQTFNKIIKWPAFANNITTIVYIAKHYDTRPKELAKYLSSGHKWSEEFLLQYEQEYLSSASRTVVGSLYKAVELLPNLRNVTASTRFEPEGFNFNGAGGEIGQSIAINRDSRWPLNGDDDHDDDDDDDDFSEVDRAWRSWKLDSQFDTAIPAIKAIAKHAELHPEKCLVFGLNRRPIQILNKVVMDFGKFTGDVSEIRNPVFVRAASHVKSFLVNFADWESWEEYLSERNQSRGITMIPTRNNSGWNGVAWRRWLRELVNLEHFEIEGCAEDRSQIIQFLHGPVLKHVGHFERLRHVSIEASDYFRYPAPRSHFQDSNRHFQTELLQNFIAAHSQTLEELNLDSACGRQTHAKTLSIDERRGLLLAIRDQCTALRSIKIQEWVKLLNGPGDLEPVLSWRRRLEAEMPIAQLAMEFGARRIYDEKGVEVLEEMSAEQTVVVGSGMADRRDQHD